MTTDRGDQHEHDDQEERKLPEHPEAHATETVEALEEQQSGDGPDVGERVSGEDVPDNPDAEGMEDLPGPPPGEPGETAA